jgi:hypothetical protein
MREAPSFSSPSPWAVPFYPLAELFGGALSLFTEHPPSRFGGRFDLYDFRR